MSNPANRLPPEYDETLPRDYDPEFTTNISTSMRVPDKIAVAGGMNGVDDFLYGAGAMHEELKRVAAMNVPDKIVVVGQEQSQGVSDPRLHLDLDSGAPAHTYVGLETPPRVLTLEDRPFPNVGDSKVNPPDFGEEEEVMSVDTKKGHSVSFHNGHVPQTPPRHPGEGMDQEALLATPGEGLLIQGDEEDDLAQLRRQVAKLHRHVQRLEDENVKRTQREVLLYPAVAGFFLFQVVKWFLGKH